MRLLKLKMPSSRPSGPIKPCRAGRHTGQACSSMRALCGSANPNMVQSRSTVVMVEIYFVWHRQEELPSRDINWGTVWNAGDREYNFGSLFKDAHRGTWIGRWDIALSPCAA